MLRVGPQDGGDEDSETSSDEGSDGWWHGDDPLNFSDEETVDDSENVEMPVSWLAGSSEVTEPQEDITFDPHLMLYLVGEAFGDGGPTSAAAGTLVRSRVCPTLPQEVVEEVLLLLPAASQARCRAVCKAWLAILTKPDFSRRSFLQAVSETTPPPLCAVRYHPKSHYKSWSYSSIQYPHDHSSWPSRPLQPVSPLFKSLKVDLSFLPKVFHSSASHLHNCSPSGFMCIRRLVDDGMHLCVLNPLNQSFKVLPMLQNHWGYDVTLSVETAIVTESIPSFEVYVGRVRPVRGLPRVMSTTWVKGVATYSSISGEWKGFLRRPGEEKLFPPAISCNGSLYATVHRGPRRLGRLSTVKGPRYLWEVALPEFDSEHDWVPWSVGLFGTYQGMNWKSEYCLAAHRGRLLCCSGRIWMLDDSRQQWVEIAGRCPPDMLPPVLRKSKNLGLQNVHVAGDFVFFCYQLHRYLGPHRPEVLDPVTYDMVGRVWRKVPQVVAKAGEVFQPMPHLRLSV